MRQASMFLVEDEVRMMLADMVEELGHRVAAEAGNIQDAQVLAETAVFDLAILDINIAGSSIVPVAEIIDRRPAVPFYQRLWSSGPTGSIYWATGAAEAADAIEARRNN
jgi:CheY-like chemotaxis protein